MSPAEGAAWRVQLTAACKSIEHLEAPAREAGDIVVLNLLTQLRGAAHAARLIENPSQGVRLAKTRT